MSMDVSAGARERHVWLIKELDYAHLIGGYDGAFTLSDIPCELQVSLEESIPKLMPNKLRPCSFLCT